MNLSESFFILDNYNCPFSKNFLKNFFEKVKKSIYSIMQRFPFFVEKVGCITFYHFPGKGFKRFFLLLTYSNLSMELAIEKTQKNAKQFFCEFCYFNTANKYDYTRHVSTRKHLINSGSNDLAIKKTQKNAKNARAYKCESCDCSYNDASGLWRHKKKCSHYIISPAYVSEELVEAKINNSSIFNPEMLMEMMRQNKDIQNLLIEQNKSITEQNIKLMDELKDVRKIQNNITNTNSNNNNNSFNLNFFLNEQCKNAVNLADFIESLQVGVKDLEKTGKLGFVEGISSIFLNGLRELDVYSRPIHCTDLKRETVYVKDQDKWEKENAEKPRLKNAVKRIATKNLKQLPNWEKENPEFSNFSSKESEQYLVLSKNSLGGYDKEEDTKYQDNIIRNVLKETKVPM